MVKPPVNRYVCSGPAKLRIGLRPLYELDHLIVDCVIRNTEKNDNLMKDSVTLM
jgi:hypothetical protein